MSRPGYLTQLTGGGTPYVDLSTTARPIQWRLYERHTNALSLTARDIIEDARLRHSSFADVNLPDGAALRKLNALQRDLLLKMRDGVKGIMTLTVRTVTQLPTIGTRVGVTPRGVPYLIEDGDPNDGYAVYLSEGARAPYIDVAGVPIARTPLLDGFPLPVEVISITAIKGVLPAGTTIPVTTVSEFERSVQAAGRRLMSFASGNRIVPLLPPGAPAATLTWESTTYVEISYIAVARATALCCLLSFPTVLTEALTAGIAKLLAISAKNCPAAEKQIFIGDAARAEAEFIGSANDILGEGATRRITFKG